VLMQRSMTPLLAQRLARLMARSGPALAAQPINLATEKFCLYVPGRKPPAGYGLLVFVSPSPAAALPPSWSGVLDRTGIIFVSAARSGNDEKVLSRREPLALLAATNVLRRYDVDPRRVYIAGFSGGGRVALRLILGYPDLFRGAILNAGSDPIGSDGLPLPSAPLFEQFQHKPVVYVTGAQDSFHLDADAESIQSLEAWCAFNIHDITTPGVGHEVMDGAALSRALRTLAGRLPPNSPRREACRSTIAQNVAHDLDQVAAMAARHDNGAAQDALAVLDRRFGGLAAPRSLALAQP
jgi:predicted esterase